MSTTIEVKVPDIGDFSDIPVIEVLVSAGDKVKAEASLVTLESDKATMEVPAPQGGIIKEVKLKVNDTVSEGDVVAILEVQESPAGEDATTREEPARSEQEAKESEEKQQPAGKEAEAAESAAQSGESASGTEEASSSVQQTEAIAPPKSEPALRGAAAVDPSSVPYASPSVRKYARELGVDLSKVKGSGEGERILKEDVTAFVKSAMSRPAEAAAAGQGDTLGFKLPPPPKVDFSRFGKVSEKPLSRIQKLSASYLHRNWVSIPHVTQHDEADVTDMEAFRKANVAEAEAQGFKLTPLVFLIKASVAAMKKYPQFNASLDVSGENLILKHYFNIGVAVDTPEGLVVPVLKECERKGIMELASELGEISSRARDNKLTPKDIQGGCFSISSLGGIGGTGFTPIINAPEVAILGVSRTVMKPLWNGKEFEPRLMLPLSLSYDHRVIDGAVAARFTRYLASQLEDLRRLTL